MDQSEDSEANLLLGLGNKILKGCHCQHYPFFKQVPLSSPGWLFSASSLFSLSLSQTTMSPKAYYLGIDVGTG